jgi:hypothetical protein
MVESVWSSPADCFYGECFYSRFQFNFGLMKEASGMLSICQQENVDYLTCSYLDETLT